MKKNEERRDENEWQEICSNNDYLSSLQWFTHILSHSVTFASLMLHGSVSLRVGMWWMR